MSVYIQRKRGRRLLNMIFSYLLVVLHYTALLIQAQLVAVQSLSMLMHSLINKTRME